MNQRSFCRSLNRCGLALALLLPLTASAATITVNSAGSMDVMGDGNCELAEAIRNANASATDVTGGDCATGSPTGVTDLIEFNIAGGSVPYTIMPTTALPIIDDTMVIDATTQSGPVICGGPLNIVLNGSGLAAGDGFHIDAFTERATIRGFSIIGFSSSFPAGIRVDGNDSTVECNYIGLGPNGDSVGALSNSLGVLVTGVNNTIGGLDPSDRNAIGNSVNDGVRLNGATQTDVLNNFIGLEINGNTAAANGGRGVHVRLAATFNNIGLPGAGNVISANSAQGVLVVISSDSNTFSSNLIGTDATGTIARGNGFSGLSLQGGDFNLIEANVVSGNTQMGILMFAQANIVVGNLIGTNAAGTAALGNGVSGLVVAPFNTIGGGAAGEGNIISGNGLHGVDVCCAGINLAIVGNFIGVGADGLTPIPNGQAGVLVGGGADRTLIGTGGPNEGNVISGNTTFGVHVSDGPGTILVQNIIGLGADGTTLVPNGMDGVLIESAGSSGAAVGADMSVPNVISGNNGFGVVIRAGANDVIILGNLIGTDASGTLDRGNSAGGVLVGNVSGTIIGGAPVARKAADPAKQAGMPN